MTDLEKFIELYKSVGIEVEPFEDCGRKVLRIEAREHEKLEGYSGFNTQIIFTAKGKFISQGFWE